MDKKRVVLIWLIMASVIAVIAYLFGAAWWLAVIIGVVAVAAIVAGATGTLYLRQKRLLESAAKFNIDLKKGKIHPADLRRMYFTGGKARKDALYIASQAMNCSVQEAEKRLAGFAKRAGWANLPAIKNNRLYAAYHANSRTLSDSASIQFMAKAIYPQLFKDFNPEKTYIDFYRQNLPVVPNGTFYLYPKGQ